MKEVAMENWQGRVRISKEAMEELALKEGDVVEVEGRRLTAAVAARGPPEDLGARVIRMDAWTARNAGVGVGDTVKVRKAKAVPAVAIVLEAQLDFVPDENYNLYVKNGYWGDRLQPGTSCP